MNTNMTKFALAAILAVASRATYLDRDYSRVPQDAVSYQQAARAAEALSAFLADELAHITPRVDFSVDCGRRDYAASVAFCQAQGKRIASIHSQQENFTILGLIQTECGIDTPANQWSQWDGVYIGAESDG
jgi:hypothetical protein